MFFQYLTEIPWSQCRDEVQLRCSSLARDLDKDIDKLKAELESFAAAQPTASKTGSETMLATDEARVGTSEVLSKVPKEATASLATSTSVGGRPGSVEALATSASGCGTQDVTFDSERMLCCSVENGHTLVHGVGGRGYGLAATPITAGCYQWKFLIVKENKGNEGTCVGVGRWPVRDYSHRTTADMWLYRAYSGNLYHNGEHSQSLPSFTQGDYVTCVLDMEEKTLSFGKNGQVSLAKL